MAKKKRTLTDIVAEFGELKNRQDNLRFELSDIDHELNMLEHELNNFSPDPDITINPRLEHIIDSLVRGNGVYDLIDLRQAAEEAGMTFI